MKNILNQLVIDFTKNGFGALTLFTGRKNGKKAKDIFKVTEAERFVFIANNEQVITSSYFLGLVGDELSKLLKITGTVNELLERVDLTGLNEVSRNECERAIKRGIVSNELYL